MTATTLDVLSALNQFEADLKATLEAAAEKGYKEFNNGGVKTATDYDPVLKQRVRVPVRDRGQRIKDDLRNVEYGVRSVGYGSALKVAQGAKGVASKMIATPKKGGDPLAGDLLRVAKTVADYDTFQEGLTADFAIYQGIEYLKYALESLGREADPRISKVLGDIKKVVSDLAKDLKTQPQNK